MLLPVGREEADVSTRLMGAGQNVGHGVGRASAPWAGVSTGAPPAHSPHRSLCREGRCGTIPASACWGTGSRGRASILPPAPMEPFPLQPCGFMSKHSAWGHAMTSEEKYTWFLSDVWGYGFINWWNTCQQKPLSSPSEVTGRCIAFRDLVWKTCAPPCALCPLKSPDFYWIQLLLIIWWDVIWPKLSRSTQRSPKRRTPSMQELHQGLRD